MNLILQHWSGEINGLTELSVENISRYAEKVGADYRLLRGNVFHPTLSAPCQKLHMLNEEFDEYDMVVMIDADMFVRKGMTENVFTDVTGIGRHTEIQDHLHRWLVRHTPLASKDHPYWGGAIYRLDRDLRKKLRAQIVESEMLQYNNRRCQDEGIMNRLAALADLPIDENTYIDGNRWDCGNFEDDVEQAAMIHVRHKMFKDGKLVRVPKMEAYADMVGRGLV